MEECSFGGGCINDTLIHLATSEMGFGGFGESGMGAYHGEEGFRTFSHYKNIVDKKTHRPFDTLPAIQTTQRKTAPQIFEISIFVSEVVQLYLVQQFTEAGIPVNDIYVEIWLRACVVSGNSGAQPRSLSMQNITVLLLHRWQ